MSPSTLIFAAAVAFTAPTTVTEPTPTLKKAPDFTLTSAVGKAHSLADFKGKFIVLEWWNYQCPLVKKHYVSGNMQKLQKNLTEQGVVWLSINSSAAGKQGHVAGDYATKLMKEAKGSPTAVLLDHDGKVGRLFDAKVTPHMFLIGPDQTVLYNGAIDSIPSSNPADVEKAENYVLKAFNEAKAGKPVSVPVTKPYGCGVKY